MASKLKTIIAVIAVYICVAECKEVFYREGKPFTLKCDIETHYNVTAYSWLKKGTIWLNISTYDDIKEKENGAIEFTNPQDYHQGSYQCFADSKWGRATSTIYNVQKATLEFEKKSYSHKAVEGKPFELKCPTPPATPKPKIYWNTIGNLTREKDDRVIQGPHIVDNTLYFREVTKADLDLKYVCMAESLAVDEPVELEEHVFEEVLPGDGSNGTAVVQYLSTDEVVRITTLDYFTEPTFLYCIYGGRKLPRIEWYKGNEKLPLKILDHIYRIPFSGGKLVKIRQATFGDAGAYACEVDIDGKKVKHDLKLTIVSPPIFISEMKSGIEKLGNDVTIPCHVAGNSLPKLKWTYNAKPLLESDRFVINRGGNDTVAIADLTIKNLQFSDEGFYGCRADNDQGYEYMETIISILQ